MALRLKMSGAKVRYRSYGKETQVSFGRGAFCAGRSRTERSGGLHRRENAGMSSDKEGENPSRRKPKVS